MDVNHWYVVGLSTLLSIVSSIITILLTNLVSNMSERQKEERHDNRKNNKKLLDEVYWPILHDLQNAPDDDKNGFGRQYVDKIIKLIEEHGNIVDNRLDDFRQKFCNEIDEHWNYEVEYNEQYFDEEYKFFEYVKARCNKLKKLDGREYDPSTFGIWYSLKKFCSGSKITLLKLKCQNIKRYLLKKMRKELQYSKKLSDSIILRLFKNR